MEMENKELEVLNQMSIERLEDILATRKKEEKERLRREREDYEKYIERNSLCMIRNAIRLNNLMNIFYDNTTSVLNEMREKLNQYGSIKANSKGGFHLKTQDGRYKIIYKYSTICDWDERSEKAEELLKDFLKDVVKKRDKDLFEVIVGLLERNREGKLEYSRMQTLYSKEDLFDDPRWKEALRLFKESFRPISSKMRLEFYKRDEQSNKWEPISLNLSNF